MAKIARLVKHRSVIDRRKGKVISQEPEMERLKVIFSDMSAEEKARTESFLSEEKADEPLKNAKESPNEEKKQ